MNPVYNLNGTPYVDSGIDEAQIRQQQHAALEDAAQGFRSGATKRTDIVPGSPAEWTGHPGVYVVIDVQPSMARVREWGVVNAPMPWTMQSELTPITEHEAVARLIASEHR